jgi:cytochrome c1
LMNFDRAAGLAVCVCLALMHWGRASAESLAANGDRRAQPERGRKLVSWYGCASCHDIPGASTAGMVGPPPGIVGRRSYLAGSLLNTPENLIRWIRYPQQVDEDTAMPFVNVSEEDARDITAFLYTLR